MEIRLSMAPGALGVSAGMATCLVDFRRQGKPGATACQGWTATCRQAGSEWPALDKAMTEAQPRYDVVVAGAGTVGLAMACALADALGPEARIALVDRAEFGREPAARDIRAWAISAGSKRLLDVLGVWPELSGHAQPVTAVDITDFEPERRDPPDPRLLRQSHRRRRAGHLHPRERASQCGAAAGGTVARDHCVCWAAVRSRASTPTNTAAASIWKTAPGCGRRCWWRLMGAAPGCASWPASRRWAGAIPRSASSRRSGMRSRIAARAVQHFLPAGPFAILPLTGDRSCITWTEDATRGREIVALDDAGFLAEVQQRFGYRLGDGRAGGTAVELAARHASGAGVRGQPVRAGRRRRARRASDCRARSQSRAEGCGGTDGGGGHTARLGLDVGALPALEDMSAGGGSTRRCRPPPSMASTGCSRMISRWRAPPATSAWDWSNGCRRSKPSSWPRPPD